MIHNWFRADEKATDDVGWTANLAIFRIIYLYFAILPQATRILRWTRRTMPLLPAGAWYPISFYLWIPAELLRNSGLAHGLALVDVCLIVLALLGFYTRSTLGLATVLSVYLFGLPQNLGKVDHYHHDVWFMALLAAGPSGEMLSIDAILGAFQRADRGSVDPEVSDRAALTTLRYLWLLIGELYLSAGFWKLIAAFDAHWLDFANLQNIIRRRWIVERLYLRQFSVGFRFDQLPPALIRLAGVGTIAFETSAIGLILFRGSRWLVIVCGLAFHLGNAVVLGIRFKSLMIAYVSMVDWAWLCRFVMNRASRTPVAIIYDGSCDFCRRVIAILKTVDTCGLLQPIAAGGFADSTRDAYSQITDEMAARDLYVVGDNSVAAGYDAYRTIAACVPLLWPLALVMPLAPIAAIGRRCYRRIADSRHCSVAEEVARPPSPITAGKKSVSLTSHVVGMTLLAAETTAVLLNSGAVFGLIGTTTLSEASARNFARWKNVKWVWPFDQYPTFTYSWDIGSYRTWEPRLVYADGSESTIAPEVFACAFGNSGSLAQANIQQAIKYDDPLSRAKQALSIAGRLWENLPDSAKNNVVAIRGYDSVFSTDPDKTESISRKLVDTLPVELLQSEAATERGSR